MTDVQAMLMQQEGKGLYHNGFFYPYQDSEGILTIGYGHNLEAKGIPDAVVMMLLSGDIADALDAVRHCFSCYDQLSRPRQLVLISMAHNLGQEKLSGFVRFIGAVHRGDWNDAADEIMDSKAAHQAPGLTIRYTELARMMRENTSAWI